MKILSRVRMSVYTFVLSKLLHYAALELKENIGKNYYEH
jgi:hypothetical protein